MQMPKSWKVTTAGAAVAGLGAFGLGLGLASTGSDAGGRPDAITLQERIAAGEFGAPAPAPDGDGGALEASQLSPDGESFDSPLQSPDDSPDGGDSLDTPGASPAGESLDSPGVSADDSPD